MELKTCTCRFLSISFFFLSCLILLSFSKSSSVEAYKNYTVGESLGWYDKLEQPSVNYQKWVAGKTFSLGDFLVFNSDNNHSVVQTYNFTTYKACDSDNADTDDTVEWSTANPSSTAPHPISVAVPLLKEGMTYFFSGDYDGEQCQNGQHFQINVTHGQGLPEALKDPSTIAPGPVSPDDEDSTPNPDTVVSSNFNNPKESSGDDEDKNDTVKKTSASSSLSMFLRNLKLTGVLVLLGYVLIIY